VRFGEEVLLETIQQKMIIRGCWWRNPQPRAAVPQVFHLKKQRPRLAGP